MKLIFNNPKSLPDPVGGYSQSAEIRNCENLLFISGQVGELPSGEIPEDFEKQCEMIWIYIQDLLEASNMTFKNLVKINTYLTHPNQSDINCLIRNRFLGDHRPALTVVIVHTLQSKWLMEIDAIAAI